MDQSRTIPIYPSTRDPHDKVQSESRRRVLKLMAASAALGGSGCSEPPTEEILPYVRMPERTVPGHPVFYASTLVRNGYGFGVLVETNMGRPTKIEGNPQHPASLGATDVYAQASILQLWDPDRSRSVLHKTRLSTWMSLKEAMRERLSGLGNGAGLRILTGRVTSPTLTTRIQRVLERYPNARWHSYDAGQNRLADAIAHQIYGTTAGESGMHRMAGISITYQMEAVQTLVALDADVFSGDVASVRHAREFMNGRADSTNRKHLYVVETTPTLCGAMADERLALAPDQIDALVHRLAQHLGIDSAASTRGSNDIIETWSAALARELQAQRGRSVVVAGQTLSPEAHRLVWRINQQLQNIGQTIIAHPCMPASGTMASLLEAIHADAVDTLLIMDVNPVYDMPPEAGVVQALQRLPCSIHFGLYSDETAAHTTWHVPRCHDLEDWGDALSPDGTASIIQPAIAPLYGGHSPYSVLGLFDARDAGLAYEHVQDYWKRTWNLADPEFETRWHDALRNGFIKDYRTPSLFPVSRAREDGPATGGPYPQHGSHDAPDSPGTRLLTAVFVNDTAVDTGTFANLPWLQELPRPFTSLTWDNAVLLGPETAKEQQLVTGDVVTLHTEDRKRSLAAPVFVLPGHAENCVSLPLGYGRSRGGSVADGVGFNARTLQTMGPYGPEPRSHVYLTATGERHSFAVRQQHHSTHDRPIVHRIKPGDRLSDRSPEHSLYPDKSYREYAWAMAIDLDTCIGCNACVIACQSENNIPVVGKEEVARGRAMHWIRIDYYHDDAMRQQTFQPMACQHCEDAPCEVVCPVAATMHDSEGLNVQVYNRCVGTRFCSNNCPYKVRRFNFFQYSEDTASDRGRRNPEVTVRQRGVMEKCTYCVQRISRARINAQKEGRRIADGDVVTACQAACPTNAITFGDINDGDSQVNRVKASPRSYNVLNELNTRPRTSYLARVENPDASLENEDG